MALQSAGVEAFLSETRDRVHREYGWSIGREVASLVTPALVLDLPAARRNIARMADLVRLSNAEIRPHIKAHKSVELAGFQIEGGAIGLSVATVWEAMVMAAAGLDHIFVVNEVADPEKIGALARTAQSIDVMVAADDVDNVRDLAIAARASGSELGVLVDVDTGMDRCGVDTPVEAVVLARQIAGRPGLRFMGVTGYEGHCSRIPDRDLRHARQREAMDRLVAAAQEIEDHGIACPIRSAGGTATWEWTAAHPGITEIQAGSYAVMDNFHGRMVEGFEYPLTVLATVISSRPDRLILNAGNKTIAMGELASIRGHDDRSIRFSEEHGIFERVGSTDLKPGSKVEVVPGYSPGTVNFFDVYFVADDARVVDVWPVIPRGPGHHGLARDAAGPLE